MSREWETRDKQLNILQMNHYISNDGNYNVLISCPFIIKVILHRILAAESNDHHHFPQDHCSMSLPYGRRTWTAHVCFALARHCHIYLPPPRLWISCGPWTRLRCRSPPPGRGPRHKPLRRPGWGSALRPPEPPPATSPSAPSLSNALGVKPPSCTETTELFVNGTWSWTEPGGNKRVAVCSALARVRYQRVYLQMSKL